MLEYVMLISSAKITPGKECNFSWSRIRLSAHPFTPPHPPLIRAAPKHVRLVCDIYCTHAYLYRYDSTVFCYRKLKSRRLNFLINCRSNLIINIVI